MNEALQSTKGLKAGDKLVLLSGFAGYEPGSTMTVDEVLTDFKIEVRENRGWLRIDRFSLPE